MTFPTVHLNGTNQEELLEPLREAYSKLNEAKKALAGTHPNGRDYYPQGSEAINKATSEHRERLEKVASVQGDILHLIRVIEEQ